MRGVRPTGPFLRRLSVALVTTLALSACAPAAPPPPRGMALADAITKGRGVLAAGTQALAEEFEITWAPQSEESLEMMDGVCLFRSVSLRSSTDISTQPDGAGRAAKALTAGLKPLDFGVVEPLSESSGGWRTTSPSTESGVTFSVGSLGYTDADATVPVDLLAEQCTDDSLPAEA